MHKSRGHIYNVGSKKLEYGPGTIYAGLPSSLGFRGWSAVIVQLSGFYCKPIVCRLVSYCLFVIGEFPKMRGALIDPEIVVLL